MDFTSFSISIMTGLIGLLMLFAGEPLITLLIVALGIYLVLFGSFLMFSTSKILTDRSFKISIYTRGGISIVLGLLCIILPVSVANFAWKAMMYILGIYAILSAAAAAYDAIKLHEAGIEVKKYIIEIVVSLLAAVLLFMLPSNFGFKLMKFLGILLIAAAVIMGYSAWKNQPIVQEDAEVVDE